MNTTEQISIGGYAFIIESDAYEELDKYLHDIRKCFADNDSTEEIVSDIEVRIGELLRERCSSGMVVRMEMVKDIEEMIGNPKEVSGQDNESAKDYGSAPKEDTRKAVHGKKLYRNIDDRVLAGVCSGLSCYFNMDKALFRIFFMIFFCLGIIGINASLTSLAIVIYLILWIAIPGARTVEQKCEMKSEPINLEGFRTNDNRFEKEIKETVSSPAFRTIGRIFCICIGVVFVICGLSGFASTIFIPSLSEIIGNNLDLSLYTPEHTLAQNILSDQAFWWMTSAVVGLASLGLSYGGIVLCLDLKSPSWKPGLVIFILWIISIIVLVAWVLKEVAEWIPCTI